MIPKYFSKQIVIPFLVFNLFVWTLKTEKQVFHCSTQDLQTLCNNQNPVTVCAVDDDNQYLTFKSACEACGYEDTVNYTQGPCKCPDIPCLQKQTCIDGQCQNIQSLTNQQLIEKARGYLSRQKYKEALIYIEKVLKLTQQDSYAFYLASLATFGDQQYKQSLKYIKKAITIDPDMPDFYVIRGRAFSGIQQFEQAEKQFQKALKMDFDDTGLLSFYQAQNLLKNKKNQEAIKKFEQALKHHPQKVQWYVRKALAHAINKEQKMAILTCKEGLKIDPKNEQILAFMQQFKSMDQGKQKDIQRMQQQNLKIGQNDKRPDPEAINKFIKQKQQQQDENFQKRRMEQKRKRQQQQKKISQKEFTDGEKQL